MKRILLLLLFPVCIFAQQREVFRINNLPQEGILLDQGWKWHAGDNPEWAKPGFDAASWEDIDPSKDIVQLTNISTHQPLWLRIKLSPRVAKNYALSISQSGASEIYLNGRLIQKIGQIDPGNQHTIAYNPLDNHLILKLDSLDNTLAIRYYFQHGLNLDPIYNIRYPFFSARIFDSKYIIASHKSYFWPGFNIGFALILFFIHGVLFLYYPALRANFWFSAWAFINILFSYFLFQLEINPYLERNAQYIFFSLLTELLGSLCLLYCLYLLLENKRKIYVYLFVASAFAHIIGYYSFDFAGRNIIWLVLTLFQALLSSLMALDANRAGDRRGMPVLFGMLAFIVFWGLFSLSYPLSWSQTSKDILFHLATLSFPVTMSGLLGFKFRQVNQSLLHNLEQVNQLYVEKQQILSAQNETLEKQVQERTAELEYKNRDLEIEASLEKVRTRALEMQKSNEVMDVANILYEQLQSLGFKYGACTIMIMDEATGDAEHWVAGFDHRKYPESYHVPYFNHPYYDAQLAAWRNGDDLLVYHLGGAEKSSYDAVMFNQTDFKNFPDAEKRWMSEIASVDFTLAYMQHVALHWGPGLLPKEQSIILQRFAKVFEQSYTRFLDLQKAEAQAREAQIEVALERVRSRTMAMQKSEHLVEVINVVAAQLLQLNFQLNTASFFLNNDSEEFTFWLAAIGESNPEKIVIPQLSNPALTNIKEAQKNGVEFWADNLSFEEKNTWFQHVFAHSPGRVPENRQEYILNAKGYARSVVLMKHIGLFIVNYVPQPYTDAENAIFKRFAFAFEQAYTRFLDLQKAEEQAREAQIEAALEKVRSTSLAIQQSQELEKVVATLFDKLKELSVPFDSAIIYLFDKSKRNIEAWVASILLQDPIKVNMPYDKEIENNPIIMDLWYAIENGQHGLNKSYKEEDKDSYYRYEAKYNKEIIPESISDFQFQAESWTTSFATEKNSIVAFDNWEGQLTSNEDFQILKRFAKVFEQAYIRFLDLQKAEEQAREAQIEAALERVRSSSMRMQQSKDLVTVINVVAEQLLQLNIQFDSTSFFLNEDSEDFSFWLAAIGDSNPDKILVPKIDNPVLTNIKAAQKKGLNFFTDSVTFEEKNAWFNHVFNNSAVPEERKKYLLTAKGYERSVVLMKQIGLFIVNFIPKAYTDEENAIFRRFAYAFEQAYIRFLDLQKAEAQAREAQIEAALERVRSRTMAMQNSDELREAANLLSHEVRGLGIPVWSCGYNIMEQGEKSCIGWMSTEGAIQPSFKIPLEVSPTFIRFYESRQKGELFYEEQIGGADLKTHYDYMMTLPDFEKSLQLFLDAGHQLPTFQVNNVVNFSNGNLIFITAQPVPQEWDIFKRFATVFEQTYTRFLDLKQAEAQAREAQIEAALEKIRSRSLAMRHSGELKDVVSIVFQKLKELNVLLGTVAIVLFDEKSRDCFFWIGNDLHDEPPLINLPYDENIFEADTFLKDCWQARLTGKGFVNNKYSFERKNKYFEYVFANNNFEVLPQSVRDFIMQAQDNIACLIVENNSTLFVDSWNGQNYSDEMLKVIKRAAAVFEQAFVRFLDLQKAEAQAREAQIEAALERVRARAMSMQTSEEINAVIGKIFTECKLLEIQLDSSIIIIYDKHTLNTKWYLTNNEDPDYPACFSVPYNEYPLNTAMLDAWQQKTIDWSYMLDVQEKKEWDKFMFSKTDFVLLPENIKEVMAAVEKLYIKASFNEFGCIMLSSLEPFNNDQMAILPRFSKVFELTYTRFNDLKIAEAQAEQAKLDLIQIQTEKKKAEDTLVELRATQAQLIQSEKLASLGELTAGIAHEIQNPLNFVNNFSELSVELLEEMETEFKAGKSHYAFEIAADLKQNLSKINHHGQRASAIVKGMLEHSRTSTGTKVATDINALTDEYLRLTYHGLRAKDSSFNAVMETHFDPDLPKVEVIPQDIGRVLLNLINNAFYAVNEKNRQLQAQSTDLPGFENLEGLGYQPTVIVYTKKLENAIEISVKDNGNGIPDNIKDKIFQPFFTTKPTGQGTGLGLSLAYDIVTKGHGGTLTVTSIPGTETIFEIQLPMN